MTYQTGPRPTLLNMGAVIDRHTWPVTDTRETPWTRLYRLVEARRVALDLTQAGIQAVGGPSPAYLRKLPNFTGPPTPRMRASLLDLDRALEWPDGTCWSLVNDDRSTWSNDLLQDEEASLLERQDEASHFGYVVAARLRAIPVAERDDVMRAILALLDVRP